MICYMKLKSRNTTVGFELSGEDADQSFPKFKLDSKKRIFHLDESDLFHVLVSYEA